MAKFKAIPKKVQLPATVDIGNSGAIINVKSQRFRMLVRSAATFCAATAIEGRPYSSRRMSALRQRYRDVLFATLTLNGTGGAQADETFFKTHDFEDSDFWPLLKDGWSNRRLPLSSPSLARLRRIDSAAIHCTVNTVRVGIDHMESMFEVQRNIGFTIPAAGTKSIRRQVKHLIQTPIPWQGSDPNLDVGKRGSFFGHDTLHPTNLNNTLILGGTGCGKTRSAVMPLLSSLLKYQLGNRKRASLLVVDPKRELSELVYSTLSERAELDRLVVIGECPPISMFTSDCTLSMSDRLEKLLIFAPTDSSSGDHTYWRNLGLGVLRDLMQLEWTFHQKMGGKRLMDIMCQNLNVPNMDAAGYWEQIRSVLAYSRASKSRLKEVDQLLRSICAQANVQSLSTTVMQVYTGDDDLVKQWCYAVQSAEPVVNAFSNGDIERFVDLDPIPANDLRTDIPALMEQGKVLLFCPEPTECSRIAAIAVKQRYYESVFSRSDLERPVGVVIDEAQKFVTSDAETGEQNFLDRCRGYRCLVVMATQSMASLKHALGSGQAAQTAVEIVSANCPTKIVMRTTDSETVAWLKTQLPVARDGDAHIIDVRRPALLQPGEAYVLLADGSWGRKRAHLHPKNSSSTSKVLS